MTDLTELIDAIRDLRASYGGLPPEREIASRLNVKRHQVRRGLAELRQAGEVAPSRGPRGSLAQPNEELVRLTNPLEVVELRLILEPSFARLASLRASALDIAEIAQWATTAAGMKPETADLNFHHAVASASRNRLARELFVMLRKVGHDARMRVVGVASATCAKRIAERDGEHRRIAEEIAARDPDAAEAAMRTHLLAVQRRIMERSNGGLAAA